MTIRKQILMVFMAGVIGLTALWSCDSNREPPPKAKVVRKKIQKPPVSKARRKMAAKSKQPQMRPKSDIAMAAPKPTVARQSTSARPAVKSSASKNTAVSPPATVDKASSTGTQISNPKVASVSPKSDIALTAMRKPNPSKTATDQAAAIPVKDPESAPEPKAKKPPKQMAALDKNKAQSGPASSAQSANTNAKQPQKGQPDPYDPTGKINPFEPLFKEKPKVGTKQVRKKRIPRTPLEKISLSQLKLVGIILADSGNRALVQESSGKGYIIKKGTYIGLNSGKVTEIRKDTVVIEEEVVTVLGKVTKNQKQLKLPKPPGE